MNKIQLQQDLCKSLTETLRDAYAGNAQARRWLATTFPGHVMFFDTLWQTPAQPENIDTMIADRQLEANELIRRLGDLQAEIRELDATRRADKYGWMQREAIARRTEWEVNQAQAQRQANEQRLAEEAQRRQANIAVAEQRQATIAREHTERAERDAANMARKRQELQEAGYWPN